MTNLTSRARVVAVLLAAAALVAQLPAAPVASADGPAGADLLWTRQLDGPSEQNSYGGEVAVHGGATYVTTQWSSNAPFDPYAFSSLHLAKLDARGYPAWDVEVAPEWEPRFAGLDAGRFGVVMGLEGEYAGPDALPGKPPFRITRWNPAGNELWSVEAGDLGLEGAERTTLTDVTVAGDVVLAFAQRDGVQLIQTLSLATGDPIKHQTTDFTQQVTWSGAVSLGGSAVLVGTAAAPSGSQLVLRRLDPSTLRPVWTRTIDTAGPDSGTGVVADAGRLYVTGTTAGRLGGQRQLGGQDVVLAAFGLDGRRQWQRQVGTPVDDGASLLEGVDGPVLFWTTGDDAGDLQGFGPHGRSRWTRASTAPGLVTGAAGNARGLRLVGWMPLEIHGPDEPGTAPFVSRYRER